MNKIRAFFLTFLLLAIINYSCKDKRGKRYKKEFYASSQLKSKGWYIKDSVLVDTMYCYYENGNIESIHVRDSLGNYNGSSKFYYENGDLKAINNYVNDVVQGFTYDYFKGGRLNAKAFWYNDKEIGDGYWYWGDGKHLATYNFHDWNGNNLNTIRYDSLTGKPTKNDQQVIFNDSIEIDRTGRGTVDARILLSNPPQSLSSLKVTFLTKKGVVIQADSITSAPYLEQIYYGINDIYDSLYIIKIFAKQYDSVTKQAYQQERKKIIKQ